MVCRPQCAVASRRPQQAVAACRPQQAVAVRRPQLAVAECRPQQTAAVRRSQWSVVAHCPVQTTVHRPEVARPVQLVAVLCPVVDHHAAAGCQPVPPYQQNLQPHVARTQLEASSQPIYNTTHRKTYALDPSPNLRAQVSWNMPYGQTASTGTCTQHAIAISYWLPQAQPRAAKQKCVGNQIGDWRRRHHHSLEAQIARNVACCAEDEYGCSTRAE